MTNLTDINLATPLAAAEYFLKLGLKIVPVPRQGSHKDPGTKKWESRQFELRDFVGDVNIGARLGEEVNKDAYLFDVDIDLKLDDKVRSFPGAAEVVAELLPTIGWVFGRDSAPRTHLMGLSSAPVTTIKHSGVGDATLIELRGLSKKKRSPQITIIPPGVHQSKERLRFDVFDSVTFSRSLDADGLATGVQHAAVALAVLHVWPQHGKRHDARLAFSKVLREAGIDDAMCVRILEAVNRATGSDVADVRQCFADTAGKAAKDTIGARWVADHLTHGAATLKVINKIMGRASAVPADGFNVTEIDLKTLTPAVWTRVADTNDPVRLCLQGGVPVRAVHVPAHAAVSEDKPKRPTWVLQTLDSGRLRHEVAQHASFYVQRKDSAVQVVPPPAVIDDMLAVRPANIPLPPVARITYAPTMADDGSIDLRAGYQPATGTFYVPDPAIEMPAVSDRPTEDEVARAMQLLLEPIAQFNFVAEVDRTHALATMLLPFVRSLIDGPTPMHLIKKPMAGAGATLLTDTLLFPAVGTDVAKMSTVIDDDEWRKTITATLLDGPSAVVIDNARSLTSPILAKVLTDTIWQARILGVSKNALLRVECTWVATGINPDLHQEVMRRVVPIRLDPRVEKPWTREGWRIPELRLWSREHRGDMMWACLTLARSWHAAGRPGGGPSLGMFESWARVIGGILRHAGRTDFLANLDEVYDEADVEGDAIRWFYEEWFDRHHHQAVKIADTAIWALGIGSPMLDLINSTSDRGRSTQYSTWVRRLKGRVIDVKGHPLRLESVKAQGRSSAHTWRLASATGAPVVAAPAQQEEIPF